MRKFILMKLLNKLSNWKVILPLSIVYLIFPLFIFNHYQAQINTLAKREVKILDIRLNYSYTDVNTLFDAMGMEGREIYVFISSRIDMAYPVIYCALLILLLAYLLKKTKGPNSKWMYLAFTPLVGTTFDFLENLSILNLIHHYPNYTSSHVASASLMSSLKWYSLLIIFGMILFLSFILLRKRINA